MTIKYEPPKIYIIVAVCICVSFCVVSTMADERAAGNGTFLKSDISNGDVSSACVPKCRTGYECYKGQCISKCKSLCEPLQKCTNDGRCVTAGVTDKNAVYIQDEYRDEKTAQLMEKYSKNVQLRQLRLLYRKKLRLTIHASLAFDQLDGVAVISGGMQAGLRKYITRNFSYHLRLGLFTGGTGGTDGVPDGALVLISREDVGFLLGPFGRFYLGATVGMQGRYVPTEITYMAYDGSPRRMRSRAMVGIGGEMGLVFGRYEHMDLNVKIISNVANTEELSCIASVGFHLFPWNSPGQFDLFSWK